MFWLSKIVADVMAAHPGKEIVVSSGVSPSGPYHVGTLREVLTAEAVAKEIIRQGGKARHIHVSDDLDVFRKVPAGLPEEYSKYLGMPLCEVPAPDGSGTSYADYHLKDLPEAAQKMNLIMETMRASEKYRAGYFTDAIEIALSKVGTIKQVLQNVSGRKLDDNWAPIQINEGGYLKSRAFVSIDTKAKTIKYLDASAAEQTKGYTKGDVKLNWRIDWPARWWLLGVDVEPFGRDHATKGGSYETGELIVDKVFGAKAPLPIAYNFINKTGDTKKMSKSAGDTITASELLKVLPAEVVWYFMLRYGPEKQLFFDEGPTLIKLIDEFGLLLAKEDKSEAEQQLVAACLDGVEAPTISQVPFSHLVASYQAALKSPERTLQIISRTEYTEAAVAQAETIKRELSFIDNWLDLWAPDDVKFSLRQEPDRSSFSEEEKKYLASLAEDIDQAPADADGEWFHKTIYKYKESAGLTPSQLFRPLYQALIGKDQGPRAGWFLSMLPKDWLIKRLRLEA